MDPHQLANFPTAPNWALVVGSTGIIAVYTTLAASILSLLLAFVNKPKLMRPVFAIGCVAMIVAFGSLATLFTTDQFSFDYIFRHSSKENPFSYKLASIWTAQEGSFMLWAVFSAIVALLTFRKSEDYERPYVGSFAVILGVLAAILVKESPFLIPKEAYDGARVLLPPDGRGMVPSLQNYWVVI
ncbi:MAG TPA: hypothetical protein VK171_05570, partial [Fimbriimonas sp.]|nr:hypothetical protein [Fimbriimonas sp.]